MNQIQWAYRLPHNKSITAITTLYKNTEVLVRSLDSDTHFVNIVAGVLQADTISLIKEYAFS